MTRMERLHFDVNIFYRILKNGTDAEQDALFESITAVSPEELAPFFLQNYRLDELRFTPLNCAVFVGSLRFICLLLQKGADHTVPEGNNGITTLMFATRHTHVLCYFLQELINYYVDDDVDTGVIINAQDNNGWTGFALRSK